MLRKICILILIAGSVSLLPSCSDTSSVKASDDNQNVSTIPWNRQEKWENGSSLPGGMIGTQ
ncbi:MAG: hypothetical protein WCD79_06840 [Chthoniobacteraceae bacterium]